MENTYIYYLRKKDSNIPFYIGKTKNPTNIRLADHIFKKAKDILLEIIDEVPSNEWKFWEKHYISLFKSWGFELTNKNNGGNGPTGGYVLSQETKNKISKANSKPKPKDFGKKLSKIKTGKSLPPGTGEKIGKTKEKPVIQFNKEGNIINNFDSAKKAAESIGVHEVNMRLHLGGKYKTCKSFIFKYK